MADTLHPPGTLDDLDTGIKQLIDGLVDAESAWSSWLEAVAPEHRRSAVNMAHYWSIRQHDLRPLQRRLAEFGLSSLGRCEGHVQDTLQSVSSALDAIGGRGYQPPEDAVIRVADAPDVLEERADDLLGKSSASRSVRIMVTLPSEAADDAELVQDLVDRGMDLARINCAHDDAQAWVSMARHVRAAAERSGRACRVAMDLGGPKLRTGELIPEDAYLRLGGGDTVRLTRDCSPVEVDEEHPSIGCTLPEVFDRAEPGHRVFFDDGKLSGTVQSVSDDAIEVLIEQPAKDNAKLKPGKGINVPDTDLPVSALTDKDIEDLDTVVEIADVVELSFVRRPEDILKLFDHLDRLHADRLGVVLKIETRSGFETLPQLLLTAMRRSRVGVMIARGDLAVEVGYERMAELQEEILWLCEAAHLPVIWATQVLESQAKKGRPSRPEVSDAAMGVRAECVMLNKGPYIGDAVSSLDSILDRMDEHLYKKDALLRTLSSWRP